MRPVAMWMPLLTVLLIVTICACVVIIRAGASGIQESSRFDRRVSIQSTGLTLKDLTREISRQIDGRLDFDPAISERVVYVAAKEIPAKDLIDAIVTMHQWKLESASGGLRIVRRKAGLPRSLAGLTQVLHYALPRDLRDYLRLPRQYTGGQAATIPINPHSKARNAYLAARTSVQKAVGEIASRGEPTLLTALKAAHRDEILAMLAFIPLQEGNFMELLNPTPSSVAFLMDARRARLHLNGSVFHLTQDDLNFGFGAQVAFQNP